MNITKLFEMQKVLDERINKEKGLEGRDLLPEKILALQVELGELANEWRGFKFWSENQTARTQVDSTTSSDNFLYFQCFKCNGQLGKEHSEEYEGRVYADCPECGREMHKMGRRNPMLEEYVDCLHFILSIGNEIGFHDTKPYLVRVMKTLGMISVVFKSTVFLEMPCGREHKGFHYENLISNFLGLGKALGFTWEQIESAYFTKNEINHARQATGY